MKKISLISELETKGSVHVPYPEGLRVAVRESVASWKEFCALPEDTRLKFEYNKADGMGVGYELKKTPGNFLDLKEDFHFTSGMHEWLTNAAAKVGDKSAVDLVRRANSLLNELTPFVVEFATQVEQTFHLDGFAREIADSHEIRFGRFLHYFGDRKVGDEIATSHADKSGFTLHLYESDPGLQFLGFDMKWRDVHMSESETVIISGMRLQYRSKNVLKALFHRVVATPKTAVEGRFAMVLFVHPKDTSQYDKQRGGRLQEFPPGFNYVMPFEELAKLFVDADFLS